MNSYYPLVNLLTCNYNGGSFPSNNNIANNTNIASQIYFEYIRYRWVIWDIDDSCGTIILHLWYNLNSSIVSNRYTQGKDGYISYVLKITTYRPVMV